MKLLKALFKGKKSTKPETPKYTIPGIAALLVTTMQGGNKVEQINMLNVCLKIAGINCVVTQGEYPGQLLYHGTTEEFQRATSFEHRLKQCLYLGKYETEVKAVRDFLLAQEVKCTG